MLEESNGEILNNGKNIKLSAALDKIFREFKSNDFTHIIAQFGKDLIRLGQINKDYFSIASEKHLTEVNKVAGTVEEKIKNQLGISGGKIKQKGYLDRLISDETLKKKIKSEILKGVTNKVPVDFLTEKLKKIVVGKPGVKGSLEQYFDSHIKNTYTQVDRTSLNTFAVGLDMKAFVYQGGRIKTSRCFCKERDGKVFTIDESNEWADLIGTDCGPIWSDNDRKYIPLTDMGGYECRHVPDYISKALAIRLRPDLKNQI